MRVALLFPGQGSQRVGMGREVAESSPRAREVFAAADQALGFPLSRLCFEGPEDALQLTENTQPAILAASIALERELRPRLEAAGIELVVAAGHSLGEYSALVSTGVLALEDALRLVRRRGQLMQQAVPVGEGAMAAVLGLDDEGVAAAAAQAAAETGGVCTVANYNAPGQVVIAGHSVAVERAGALAREHGAKRALTLPVSAPFHCPLMAPARVAMTPLLEGTTFRDPEPPVVCNVDAAPVRRGAEARDALIRQIDAPVRWVESVRRMVGELAVDRFLEVGPGSVLTGLVKRIERGADCRSVEKQTDVDTALAPPGGGAAV
ncbi:MAG TPA: ACP S-malonyltransferase [Thermoanaerobaculia bacterium]|nr:ACP S-malonyltransferase [Thermoanaerobaculia bacterium]